MACIGKVIFVATWLLGAQCALAVENLESNFPTELEDAEPVEHGRKQIILPLLWDWERSNTHRLQPEPRFQWGFAERSQLSLSVPITAGSTDRTGSGDVRLEWMRKFNDESRMLPAVAGFVRIDLPSGRQSHGVDTNLRLAATKTLGTRPNTHQVHANVIWIKNVAPQEQERAERARLMLGYSTLMTQRSVLVVNLIREQSRERGQMASIAELGLVHELAPGLNMALGVGTGRGGVAPRLRLVGGLQQEF